MAIGEQEAKDLAKAQKGLNKQFTELTTKMGEVNGTLAKEAANLRKSSRDTFQGMLNARKLAKVSQEIADDKELQQFGETIEVLNGNREKLIKSQDDINSAQDKALKEDESINAKREKLATLQMNLDTDIFTSKKAEKAAQKSANDLQRQINKESTDIQNKFVDGIKESEKALKDNQDKLKKQRELQENAEEKYSEKLKASSEDGNFSKFSDGLKELSGGAIDLGDAFDGVIKKINAIKNIVESLGNFGEALQGLSIMMGMTSDVLRATLLNKFPIIGGFLTKIGTGLMSVLTGIDTMFGFIGKGIMAVGRGIKFLITNPLGALKAAWNFLSTGIASMATGFMAIGKRMIKGLKNFAMSAYTFLATGLKSMATGFVTIGKQFIKGAIRMAVSAATMVAGMLATAASVLISGLVMMAPAILIGLAVAALIFGVMYLAKKFEENKEMIMFKWGLIQEAFSIAIAGLVLWKDKAVNFIGNVFEDIWMSIKSLFSSIMTGIENGINFAIQGINSFLPKRFQIDEVDIGAKGMAAGLDEEKAAIAVERDAEAVEFAERKQALETRTDVMQQAFIDGPPPKSGEELGVATTEVKQAEENRNKASNLVANSVSDNSSNSVTTNIMGSPQTTINPDRTAGLVANNVG